VTIIVECQYQDTDWKKKKKKSNNNNKKKKNKRKKMHSHEIFYIFLLLSFYNWRLLLADSNLVLHISNMYRSELDNPVKHISFCTTCGSPTEMSSFVNGLMVKHLNWQYEVTGKVVYCVPNYADSRVLNAHQFAERIVMIDRGRTSIQRKIEQIIDTDAVAVVIFDDGSCDSDFNHCGTLAGSKSKEDGGFLPNDNKAFWERVDIPVLLITLESAERLRKLMRIDRVNVLGRGMQNVTHIEDNDEL
jgi:hypothetical protein